MVLVAEEARLTRDALRYGFAVGKVKVLANRALDHAAWERLIDASDFAEQKRLLSETPYGRYLDSAQTAEEVERGLDQALEDSYAFLEEAALPAAMSAYFRLRYDFANLKAVAKARLLDTPASSLLVAHGSVDPELFAGDLGALPEPLAAAASALPAWVRKAPGAGEESAEAEDAADAAASDEPADERRMLLVDTAIDKAMFVALGRAAASSRSRYLVDLARLSVDLANIKTIVRARRLGLDTESVRPLVSEGGQVATDAVLRLIEAPDDQLLSAIERMPGLKRLGGQGPLEVSTLDARLDAVTAEVIRQGRSGPPGPEPVIAYVFDREHEIAGLRVVLLGVLAGLDREALRRHVRKAG